MRWAVGTQFCRDLIAKHHSLRFGPAWSPPWVGACQKIIAEEIDRGLLLLESATQGNTVFTQLSNCNGTSSPCFEINVGDGTGTVQSGQLLLDPEQCYYTQPCEICFDDDVDSLKAWRRGVTIVSLLVCLVAAYWWLEVLSTKKVNPKRYGELAAEIWSQKKLKAEIEKKERLCEARHEKISQQRNIFAQELARKQSAVAAGHRKSTSSLEAFDEDDAEDEQAALNVVRHSLAHKVEDLEERLADEDAQRLEYKMQAVKLEGTISVMERSMRQLIRKNSRARFVWSLTIVTLGFHAFYVLFLCPNRGDRGCSSLQKVVAERAAAIAGLPSPGAALSFAQPLSADFTLALARREAASSAEIEQCLALNTATAKLCVDKIRASRAAQLAQQYYNAECGGLLRGWTGGTFRLSYAQSLLSLLSRLVRHTSTTFFYQPQHKAIEAAYCSAWAGVVQSVETNSPKDLRALDYASVSQQRLAQQRIYSWETLALSLLHRTLTGDRDRNTDGISDDDLDANGVPDALQLSLDAFLLQPQV